jgi:ribosomal protein S12 methylthiotransferase
MRRWGDGERFLARIDTIRRRYPEAAFRSSFIVGYPGETEADHDELLRFLEGADLDWAGFFAYSREEGTYAADLPDSVDERLIAERLIECSELQDRLTARRRTELIGTHTTVLVDAPGVGRSHREAPEIDGIVRLPDDATAGLVGQWVPVEIIGAAGPDVEAVMVGATRPAARPAARPDMEALLGAPVDGGLARAVD